MRQGVRWRLGALPVAVWRPVSGLLLWVALVSPVAVHGAYFGIHVTDAATGRGVPLVRVRTLNGIAFYTDNAGAVAFSEPGLMDREVFFEFHSDGYAITPDGLGSPGRTLRTTPGTSVTIAMNRTQPAERLYRITGQGLYRDTVLLGATAPIREPMLNASVLGQDSALTVLWQGRLFWIWGDTTHPRHPLGGSFKACAGLSPLPGRGGLDPDLGVQIDYITTGGFVQPVVPWPPPEHPHWIGPLFVVPDAAGRERMVAFVVEIKPPMETVKRSVASFDDATSTFVALRPWPLDFPVQPNGVPVRVRESDGEWLVFTDCVRHTRVRPTFEAATDPEQWQAHTCLAAGEKFSTDAARLVRGSDGRLAYAWRHATQPVGIVEEDQLESAGLVRAAERQFEMRAAESGARVRPASGMVAWNAWRGRYVAVFVQMFGRHSVLGDVWYADGPSPLGPWENLRLVASHRDMSYYNPIQHPEFARDGGRVIYFEGTFTRTFSSTADPVPRYEYNQLMYRLDLAALGLTPGRR
jgi:hypothetical protein